jgi:hypothetical protein
MLANLTIWHNRRDTLLRITDERLSEEVAGEASREPTKPSSEAPYYSVHIPIGISPGTLHRHNVTVEYKIDLPYPAELDEKEREYQRRREQSGTFMRIGLDQNKRGSIRRITPDYLGHLRYVDAGAPGLEQIRPYLEIDRIFQTQSESLRPAYYEATLHYIPRGARLRYRIKVYFQTALAKVIPQVEPSDDADTVRSDDDRSWYSVYLVCPAFECKHIRYCKARPSTPDINVVYWKDEMIEHREGERRLLTFRFDFYDVRRAINDFQIERVRPDSEPGKPSSLTYAWFSDGTDLHSWFADKRTWIAETWHLPDLAVVNYQFDYVTLTMRMDELVEGEQIHWQNEHLATYTGGEITPSKQVQDATKVKPIRLMFIHYANQALNDMFESPNKSYSPPRTYIQTTMSDPLGTYSSRPNSNELGIGDGYGFVIESHRNYGLPCLLAFAGGFLSMLAQDSVLTQDSPNWIDTIKDAMHLGSLEPVIGGFAGHRMLYFQSETNRQAIQRGIDLIENILGSTGSVFYPNSRLYAATDNIDNPIRGARIRQPLVRAAVGRTEAAETESPIQFVVVDAAAFDPFRKDGLSPNLLNKDVDRNTHLWREYEHAYIWRQTCRTHWDSGQLCTAECETWYWLFIDRKMKDELFEAPEDEWRAGKLFSNLRQHFFYGVSQPAKADRVVFVYSDDADKAAGNGWFDGDYGGIEKNYAAIFDAALKWIAAHPWLKVVRAVDLDPDADCVGTIELHQAIDPSIHRDEGVQGRWSDNYQGERNEEDFFRWSERQLSLRGDGLGFEYASWYQQWRNYPALWLGDERTMRDIAATVERAVMVPEPANSDNDLVRLAQLGFLLGIHEPHWSKKPLEAIVPVDAFRPWEKDPHLLPAYNRPECLEPENFVLAQTLQMRNAHVFLYAATWIELLRSDDPADQFDDSTRKNDDPLVRKLSQFNRRTDRLHLDGVRPELQWDLDITENVILYNRKLLVVMDSNGGRITHIFAATPDSEPVVVSGNIKTYQFLGDDRRYGGTLNCNGSVIQNTVSVANHRYVASDVAESLAQWGKRFNPKPRVETKSYRDGSWRVATGVVGDEDWLYPDNFNMYRREDQDNDGTDAVKWSFPGSTWTPRQPPDHFTSASFDQDLANYRKWILAGSPDDQYRDRRPDQAAKSFTKTIRLTDNRITITYEGNFGLDSHRVANEFSLDLYKMVMYGHQQERAWQPDPALSNEAVPAKTPPTGCELWSTSGRVRARVQLGENCRFSDETLEGVKNLRLHRAFSDCLEVESTDPVSFSYAIEIDAPPLLPGPRTEST